jgi:putative DNA methylase
MTDTHNQRLIEHGFPCHQVGAETQRERDTGKAPSTHRLHVWWARRPLTPSRAAILASLLPAEADTEAFLRQLGIERVEALLPRDVGAPEPWVINEDKLFDRIEHDEAGQEWLVVDALILRRLESENQRRAKNRELIQNLIDRDPQLKHDALLQRWRAENAALPERLPREGTRLRIHRSAADSAFAKERIEWEKAHGFRIQDDVYGYNRAFTQSECITECSGITVLDPTAGGGSIPFEALRLGHNVIANELNPVATVILYATLDYPIRFGAQLTKDIKVWGKKLLAKTDQVLSPVHPDGGPLPQSEKELLQSHLSIHFDLLAEYDYGYILDYLFARQVTCPHCGGEAALLNSCWLAKEGEQWGVAIIPNPQTKDVCFEMYRVKQGKGPKGEDPELATVADGVGTCVHCKQAIPEDEVKRQARGESEFGTWMDRLYCVVAVRYQPKLDKQGKIERYKSGERKGEIKTEKVAFFRPPNARDIEALEEAKYCLDAQWDEWDAAGLIPTEEIPPNSNYNRGHRLYGIMRWCDMFTPRQLLGHLTLAEELNRLKPQILEELGEERGRAVVTYLQFAIDKGVDYNSTYTRWIPQRGSISGTFG